MLLKRRIRENKQMFMPGFTPGFFLFPELQSMVVIFACKFENNAHFSCKHAGNRIKTRHI